MNVTFYRVKNLSYILVDEFFTADELEEVEQEIRDLKRFSRGAENIMSALDENGSPKKTGTGLFLDGLYFDNREASAILRANRKIFSPKFVGEAVDFDIVFNFINRSNSDHTLLTYYQEGQEYKVHEDSARVSAVTFLREGVFGGGELSFPDQEVAIDALHNRTVIFPSCTSHRVLPVHGSGTRVSIAQFIDKVQ